MYITNLDRRRPVLGVVVLLALAGCQPQPASRSPEELDPERYEGVSRSELTKGSGGVNGATDYCNDPAYRCAVGEGDCDSSAQCQAGLV